jgi:hypothetical protein
MIRSHLRSLRAYVIAAAALSLGSACSGDDGGSATASSTGESSSSAGGTESTSAGTETVGESESTSESTTGEATEREGCEGAKLLINPEDPALPGPWPVGARTVTIAERTTEIWYPAEPGSAAGVEPEVYDIRLYLPPEEQGKIPDDAAPWQACGCYRDLPLDTDHGPYPVIVFIHGTAGFRTQSLTFMTHWASRGFVVVSSDHTGITLADVLGGQLRRRSVRRRGEGAGRVGGAERRDGVPRGSHRSGARGDVRAQRGRLGDRGLRRAAWGAGAGADGGGRRFARGRR